MVRLILIICTFCFCACSNEESSIPEGEKIGNQAMFDFMRKVQSRGLYAMGFGGAEKEGKTRELSLTFESDVELTIPIARELIVELADDFLQEVNKNEQLKSYLSEYPFTAKNLNICVFGKNRERNDLLSYVAADASLISYQKKNPTGGLPITVLEETYEEAKQKIKELGVCPVKEETI